MTRFLALLLLLAASCSPYKKVTLTASDRLTNRWKGSTETQVVDGMGPYKSRSAITGGYIIRFDYSYPVVALPAKTGEFQVKASNEPNSMTPKPAGAYHSNEQRDSVIRRMDFYFDPSKHLQQVIATGFPDSVYYIKRK